MLLFRTTAQNGTEVTLASCTYDTFGRMATKKLHGSSMNWRADGSSHAYTFTYDGVNRLLDATHGSGVYTEKVTGYDKNGNIKALQRYGGGLIDNLTYTYNGNQVTRVDDATGTVTFSDGSTISADGKHNHYKRQEPSVK